MLRARRLLAVLALAGTAMAGAVSTASSRPHAAAGVALTNWTEFGLNPQRTNATDESTGITAANVRRLRLRVVSLPGGVADNSALYLHGALVRGAHHDVVIVTTDYGVTLALDAGSGATLWRFDPPGLSSWEGSAQITTASPLVTGGFVYATSPNGMVHKLALATGREAHGWPVSITPLPSREKLTASLNIADGDLLASTGGYFGDTPPYIGHLVAISLASGRIEHVFNTLCSNLTTIVNPSRCSASDSAILSRSGPVVEPGARRVLIATGNAPYNGTTDFGDSVIELTLPGLRLRQVYTPTDQAQLNTGDEDLGSGSPALLPGNLVLIGGKDSLLRLLNLGALDGHAPGTPPRTGGELQILPTPGSQQPFTTPAVWHDLVFVTDDGATAAYRVAGGRLHEVWSNGNVGTSPVVAGGLLYIFDPRGSIDVLRPQSGRILATLSTRGQGHWNSPIVVDGRVIEPVGNDNAHATSGQLDIFSLPR